MADDGRGPRVDDGVGHRRREPTRWAEEASPARWIAIVCWVVVAALAWCHACACSPGTGSTPSPSSTTVTLFIYLPAWIVVVVAAVGRRFLLAAAALLIVLLQIVLVAPEFDGRPAGAVLDGPRAPSIRLLDANV